MLKPPPVFPSVPVGLFSPFVDPFSATEPLRDVLKMWDLKFKTVMLVTNVFLWNMASSNLYFGILVDDCSIPYLDYFVTSVTVHSFSTDLLYIVRGILMAEAWYDSNPAIKNEDSADKRRSWFGMPLFDIITSLGIQG